MPSAPVRVALYASALAVVMVTGCTQTAPESQGSASTAPAAEAPWAVTLEATPLPAGPSSSEPQLSASSRGVIASWLEQSGRTATLRFSERTADGAWSPARTVAAGDDWFLSWADVPSVLRLRDGTLVAQWLKSVDVLIEAYDVRLSYSRDDGRTWARPFSPHHDGTKTQHGFVSLFEWPAAAAMTETTTTTPGVQGLGLVWLDGREQELNTTDPEGGAMALQFASFSPAWKQTAEAVVNPRVCECCQTSVAVTSDGVVAAFRDRSPREIRDINVSRFERGAWAPATPVHVDNWKIDSCPVNGPVVSALGQRVAVGWFTVKNDEGHAYTAFSSDGGRHWSEPIRLDSASSLGHVDVELLDDGSAVATWVEFANQRSSFQARRVEASGRRSAPIEVGAGSTGRISGYPRVARAGADVVFAWTESTGDGDAILNVKGAVARRATAP